MQSNLMPLLIHHSHITRAKVAMSVSTTVAADWLAAYDIKNSRHVKENTHDFTFYTVVCGSYTMCSLPAT